MSAHAGADTNIREQTRIFMQRIYVKNEEEGSPSTFYAPKTYDERTQV